MIVVVGGQSRKCGKTRAVCDIISATRDARWTAVKITSHQHDPKPRGDTERYLEAGADCALLLESVADLPQAPCLIIESNAAAEALKPDFFVFVTDPDIPEWKESALRVLPRAHAVVERTVNDDIIRRVRSALAS